MRKILLMLIAGVAATALHAKDFYLTGDFNGWQPNQPAYRFIEADGVYTLSLATITGELKITTSAWEEQFGCNSTIAYGRTYTAVQTGNGSNIRLPEDPAYDVTIVFDYKNRTLRIDKETTLYLVGDFNDWQILPNYAFRHADGVYTLTTRNFSGRFKVASAGYGIQFGGAGQVNTGAEKGIAENGDDMTFTGSSRKYITLTLNPSGTTNGIVKTGTDAISDAPAEYFDLSGRRVVSPGPGIYIRRQGSNIEKILK